MTMALLLKKAVPLRRFLQSRDFSSSRHIPLLTNSKAKAAFEAWAHEHGKEYESANEKKLRYWIFRDKLRTIKHYNSVCKPSMKVQPNQFSDWTPEELWFVCRNPPIR